MFAKKLIPLVVAGLMAGVAGSAAAAEKLTWITVGDTAYQQLQKLAPQAIAKTSATVDNGSQGFAAGEKVHLVQVSEKQMLQLSEAVHQTLKRCGGYMYHPTEAAGRKALAPKAAPGSALASLAAVRPSYTLDNASTVNAVLPLMQASNIGQTIIDLSNFTNRYYQTTHGVNASNWLLQKWQGIAAGRSDITVEQFTHAAWKQKSVIVTIKGTDNASEIVVLGAHLDSIAGSATGETTRAPGADDDASGVASMTEALRAMVANGYKPRRTIKMMAYAAEEVGLRGSQEIANSFKNSNAKVVGVMQLDMTNYKGSTNDIYIYTDYTDSLQNGFVANLIATYQPTLKVGYDKCGYGCSDHASWTAAGFYASMPFESTMAQYNPNIHTANDTYANMGSQAAHALKFARLGASFAIELGSDGPVVDNTKTETFTGSLAKGATKSFGPFKVAGGGVFKLSTTGTGDIDLYGKNGAIPTTSSYGCKSDGSTATENCSITFTSNGDGYVLLKGYTAGTYTLTVNYKAQ